MSDFPPFPLCFDVVAKVLCWGRLSVIGSILNWPCILSLFRYKDLFFLSVLAIFCPHKTLAFLSRIFDSYLEIYLIWSCFWLYFRFRIKAELTSLYPYLDELLVLWITDNSKQHLSSCHRVICFPISHYFNIIITHYSLLLYFQTIFALSFLPDPTLACL